MKDPSSKSNFRILGMKPYSNALGCTSGFIKASSVEENGSGWSKAIQDYIKSTTPKQCWFFGHGRRLYVPENHVSGCLLHFLPFFPLVLKWYSKLDYSPLAGIDDSFPTAALEW